MAIKKQQQKILNLSSDNLVWDSERRLYFIDAREVKKEKDDYIQKIIVSKEEVLYPFSSFKSMSTSRLIEMAGVRTEVIDEELDLVERFVDDLTIVTFNVDLTPPKNYGKKKAEKWLAYTIDLYRNKFHHILTHGFAYINLLGDETIMMRGIRSASQTRVNKSYFAAKHRVDELVKDSSFNACFLDLDVEVNIAKLQARLGLATSNSIRFRDHITDDMFNVLPDHEVKRTGVNAILVGSEEDENGKIKQAISSAQKRTFKWAYADGQGTALPSYFVKVSLFQEIITLEESKYLLRVLNRYNEDIFTIFKELKDEKFFNIFRKVPQAMQIRFSMTKGLLFMFPHNLEQYRQDCNKKTYRTTGDIVEFGKKSGRVGEDGKYVYNFDAPICFTDSMWKENFDPKAFKNPDLSKRPYMEIVLMSKPGKQKTYMGYQFWNALGSEIDIVQFSQEFVDDIRNTIFVDPNAALEFLGAIETNGSLSEEEDPFTLDGEQDDEVADDDSFISKREKLAYVLKAKPAMISDRWVQETLSSLVMTTLEQMRDSGRIAVDGTNPYIIADAAPMFGCKPVLKKGEYYYNGRVGRAAAFRSPLVDESEAVVLNLVDVPEWKGGFKDILVFNWYDDTLTRMGGADTDGDKVSMVFDDRIINAVKTGLPLVTDDPGKPRKGVMDKRGIANYDMMTILPEAEGEKVWSIGEITNLATVWSDIAKSPRVLKMLGIDKAKAEHNVRVLRGMQGITIDFAKTGISVPMDDSLILSIQPAWKANKAYFKKYGKYVTKDVNRKVVDDEGNETYELWIYMSESPMQKNWDYMNDVIKNMGVYVEGSDGKIEKNESYVRPELQKFDHDFRDTITESRIVNMKEYEEIVPVMGKLASDYSKMFKSQLSNLHDEEEISAMSAYIIEMFQTAVATLPYSDATKSAAAYQACYGKGGGVSFVWNCCFPGMIQLLEASKDGLGLFALPDKYADSYSDLVFIKDGVIDITLENGKEKKIKVVAPDGHYDVLSIKGRHFINIPPRYAAEEISLKNKARHAKFIGKTCVFTVLGFAYKDVTSEDFVNALKANDGVLVVKDTKLEDKQQVAVFVGEKPYGIVLSKDASEVLPFLDENKEGIFAVNDYMSINPFYTDKNGKLQLQKIIKVLGVLQGDLPTPPEEEKKDMTEEARQSAREEYLNSIKKDKKKRKSSDSDYSSDFDYPSSSDYPSDFDYPSSSHSDYSDAEEEIYLDEEEDEEVKASYDELYDADFEWNMDASKLYSKVIGFYVDTDGENPIVCADIQTKNGETEMTVEISVVDDKYTFLSDTPFATLADGTKAKLSEALKHLIMQMAKYGI